MSNAATAADSLMRLLGDKLLTDELERRGYVVAKPSEQPPEVEPSIHDQLRARMECLASDLQVIDGMTKRGGSLSPMYASTVIPSMQRYANRIFSALFERRPVKNDWDRSE